ncbi:MAG: hypothetical protein LKM38_30390 [Pseudomonas veronii]|nr:hypothetical protein [Pseudomonas veronii]
MSTDMTLPGAGSTPTCTPAYGKVEAVQRASTWKPWARADRHRDRPQRRRQDPPCCRP